jgi:hypothetical protein
MQVNAGAAQRVRPERELRRVMRLAQRAVGEPAGVWHLVGGVHVAGAHAMALAPRRDEAVVDEVVEQVRVARFRPGRILRLRLALQRVVGEETWRRGLHGGGQRDAQRKYGDQKWLDGRHDVPRKRSFRQ